MSTYAMCLLFAALSATESDTCNQFYSNSSISMWLSIAFVLVALCYSAMKANLLGRLCRGSTGPDSENTALLGNVNSNGNNYGSDDSPRLTTQQKKQNTIYFHWILMLAGCEMAMLFTDWDNGSGGVYTKGIISQWVFLACQWVGTLCFWRSLFVFYKESRTIQK